GGGARRGGGPVVRPARGGRRRRARPVRLRCDHEGRRRGPRYRGRSSVPGPRGLMKIDVFTLFPEWFGWFREQRHVRNALDLGHTLDLVNFRDSTPLRAGQVDDTPYGGGAGMVIRVDVMEAALRARYGVAPVQRSRPRRVVARAAGGRQFAHA